MARLDNPRVHRADRHLENALSLNFSELMPFSSEGGQLGAQIKILPQRMHIRPVVVQRATAWIGMAKQFQSEQVLDFPLLPVDGGDGVSERSKLRIIRRDWHPQDKKTVSRIERVNVIKHERALCLAGVVGENAHQPGL